MKKVMFAMVVAAACAAPAVVQAHFKLMEPASWIVESERGDPQKAAPCGTTPDAKPTDAVTKVTGGAKLHLKVLETIYHPGHYRVALAVNSREELPADPQAVTRDSERGPWSVSAPIQNPPVKPVLADGLFVHTSKPAEPFEADIELPNINCPKCTLQITEFMAEHGYNKDGGYTYHHCADLSITADPSKPLDKGWPVAK